VRSPNSALNSLPVNSKIKSLWHIFAQIFYEKQQANELRYFTKMAIFAEYGRQLWTFQARKEIQVFV
jgi:hypothetical protein